MSLELLKQIVPGICFLFIVVVWYAIILDAIEDRKIKKGFEELKKKVVIE